MSGAAPWPIIHPSHPSHSSSGIEAVPGLAHAREIRVKITVKLIDQAKLPSQKNKLCDLNSFLRAEGPLWWKLNQASRMSDR
jgi:hypothetical protein